MLLVYNGFTWLLLSRFEADVEVLGVGKFRTVVYVRSFRVVTWLVDGVMTMGSNGTAWFDEYAVKSGVIFEKVVLFTTGVKFVRLVVGEAIRAAAWLASV